MSTGTFSSSVGSDDVLVWNGNFWDGYSTLTFGKTSDVEYIAYILLKNVNIPKNATISSAVLSFVATSDEGNGCSISIYCENTSSPVAPTNLTQADSILSSLGTHIAWNSVASFTTGATYQSPDISAAIQSIVNRSDWILGGDILIVIRDNGSYSEGRRQVKSFEAGAGAPVLDATWTGGVVPVDISPPAASIRLTALSPYMVAGLTSSVYEWEGDTTQPWSGYVWKSKLILLSAITNFSAARVEADFSVDQSAYLAAVENRRAVIARNAAALSSGLLDALIGGAPIGTYVLGGDYLETVPTVGAYSGDAYLRLKVYADGVLMQTVDIYSGKPFRLLGGYRSKQFSFQLEGNIAVKKLEIATSIGDLVEA